MALRRDFLLMGAIVIPNAYHRISWRRGYKNENGDHICSIDMMTHADKGGEVLHSRTGFHEFILDMNSPLNELQQAYASLKSLPEYAGATDDI